MNEIVLVLVAAVAGGAVLALVSAVRPHGGPSSAVLRADLARVSELVRELEGERQRHFGDLAGQLRLAGQQTVALAETTRELREALSSTKARGQWGERMADDVLRLAGFVEGVNYRKRRALAGGGVPDFTFLLPAGHVCHMDVKFPLDNYLRFVHAGSDVERQRHKKLFLRDVRERIRELAERDYCAGEESVDVVLLFIPNEHLYGFIHEHDPVVIDDALRARVVMCSPLTLFAVLAVIREAAESFLLERRSKEILALMGGFTRQWDAFVDQMDKLGRRIDAAGRDYEALAGTRRRQLERQLQRVEDLRKRESVPGVAAVAEVAIEEMAITDMEGAG